LVVVSTTVTTAPSPVTSGSSNVHAVPNSTTRLVPQTIVDGTTTTRLATPLVTLPYGLLTTTPYHPASAGLTLLNTSNESVASANRLVALKYH